MNAIYVFEATASEKQYAAAQKDNVLIDWLQCDKFLLISTADLAVAKQTLNLPDSIIQDKDAFKKLIEETQTIEQVNALSKALSSSKHHCSTERRLYQLAESAQLIALMLINGNYESNFLQNNVEQYYKKIEEQYDIDDREEIKSYELTSVEDDVIYALATENALKFKGRANPGSIIAKVIGMGIGKQHIPAASKQVQQIVKEVNDWDETKQQETFDRLKHHLDEKESVSAEDKELPDLPGKTDNVVTRIPPEPSKYLHLGHALAFCIQYQYAQKYDGKAVLRFEDTNPEKSTQEFVDKINENLDWLHIEPDETMIVSEHMGHFYEIADKLVAEGHAYTCGCSQDEVKQDRIDGVRSRFAKQSIEEVKQDWQKIKNGEYESGQKVLRLKGNMTDTNSTMLDPIIFRISKAKHYKTGENYCAWPLYDFANPIADAMNGVTHVIRTKEFEMRAKAHKYITTLLQLSYPRVREIARFNVEGATTKGREIRELIESGELAGWDDPRLMTVIALRKRGFVPEMFMQLARQVGLSKSSGKIDQTMLASVNRRFVEDRAKPLSFSDDGDAVTIIMADASIQQKKAQCDGLSVDDIVKFEGLGYCRLDAIIDGAYTFYFTHD